MFIQLNQHFEQDQFIFWSHFTGTKSFKFAIPTSFFQSVYELYNRLSWVLSCFQKLCSFRDDKSFLSSDIPFYYLANFFESQLFWISWEAIVETFWIALHPAVARNMLVISLCSPSLRLSLSFFTLVSASKDLIHVFTYSGSSSVVRHPIGVAIVVP